VTAAHLTANDAFQLLSFLLPDVHEALELANVDEFQAIAEELPKRKKSLAPMAPLLSC
jgi:hypothetical protein